MFDPTMATTELEAVNVMLGLIQQPPITTLAYANQNSDVAAALMQLRMETKAVLSTGWTFNTDLAITLTPAVGTGFIIVSDDTARLSMRLDKPGMGDVRAAVRRQDGLTRLYDRTGNTFAWTKPLIADRVFFLNFSAMPEALRAYVMIRAGRKFQVRLVGGTTSYQLTASDEAQALMLAGEYSLEEENPNFLTDSPDVASGWALGR